MSHISEFKIVKTALWKVSGSRLSCLATTLFVCDTLRCNAVTPDCDVTHFDWQLQCSACFNSFLSGDSTATPWENCRSPDTHTHRHTDFTHTHTRSHTLTHTDLTLSCKLPQSPFVVYWLQWKQTVMFAQFLIRRVCDYRNACRNTNIHDKNEMCSWSINSASLPSITVNTWHVQQIIYFKRDMSHQICEWNFQNLNNVIHSFTHFSSSTADSIEVPLWIFTSLGFWLKETDDPITDILVMLNNKSGAHFQTLFSLFSKWHSTLMPELVWSAVMLLVEEKWTSWNIKIYSVFNFTL